MGKRSTFTPDLRAMIDQWVAQGYVVEIDAAEGKIKVLPPEAMAVIKTMPRRAPEIFPFSAETISITFTRACKILGIDDLHFHDLRHEGISRLFEMGWTIPHVAAVSGHRSWQSLKRYTHLQAKGDRWAGWTWEAPGSNRNDDAVTVATSRTPK